MQEQATLAAPDLDDSSRPFVARWNGLVSTTNWEKGRIIFDWRQALIDAGADVREYSDEAWARRVGTVSSQHVGRLRRVHERFEAERESYPGLYWSHFQTALEWPDPELWLEGAVQNDWSVAEMRRQRWEAYGAAADEKPRDEDVISAEFDEDALPAGEARQNRRDSDEFVPDADGPDFDAGPDFGDEADVAGVEHELYVDESAVATLRPFEDLPELPADLGEAFEMIKLSILRHKISGWNEVSPDDVLATLDGLKQLVLAPSE